MPREMGRSNREYAAMAGEPFWRFAIKVYLHAVRDKIKEAWKKMTQ